MNMMARRLLVLMGAALSLSGCATLAPGALATAPSCEAGRVDSPPGLLWWDSQRWRYASDEAATAAYQALVSGQSPWPDWFTPAETVLPAGARVQMAIGGAQTPEQPGGFATFDNIDDLSDVRDGLAVLVAWKPEVDRVVIYETLQPLPVRIGPVGPQVDPGTCRLLIGRWSQMQMMVPPTDRMTYLRVIEVRPLSPR